MMERSCLPGWEGLRCLFDSIGLKETDVGLSGTGAGAVDGEADQ